MAFHLIIGIGVPDVKHHIPIIMDTFIKNYLEDKELAMSCAISQADDLAWCDSVDEDMIYRQLSSPEFNLYQEIILCI